MTVRLSLLAALVVALSTGASAQTCTTSWAAPVSGSWSTIANWTAGVPGPSDTACITASGTYTVSFFEIQNLAGLVLGGDSGTQTLDMSGTFLTLGSGTIRPNGRVENRSRVGSCPTCGGFPSVTGTLTLEGVFVQRRFTSLLGTGGTLDVAPGGRLVIDASPNGARIGDLRESGQPNTSTLRVRGRIEMTTNDTLHEATIDGGIEVLGGTIAVQGGVLRVRGDGLLRDATFEVAEGATARLNNLSTATSYVVEGTLSGDPAGTLEFIGRTEFLAAPANATLDVGGTGLIFRNQSGGTLTLASGGGEFVNAGLVRFQSNAISLRQVVFRNRGMLRSEGSGAFLAEGAVLRNEAVGTLELLDGSNFSLGDQTGRFENAGLLHARQTETIPRTSRLNGRLFSLPGSELRIGDVTRLNLDTPASASLPADVTATGTGVLFLPGDFLVEGTISPGTEAQPIATFGILGAYIVSQTSGSPQLVIDVDAGGASDRIAFTSAVGFTFPIRPSGTLVVRVRPGYVPQIGDTFTILQGTRANQIQGEFTQVVAQGAPDGVAFVAEYDNTTPSTITLRAVEGPPVSGEEGASVPAVSLSAAPNPSRGASAVTLGLGEAQDASVVVFDALGREVARLHAGPLAAGPNTFRLDAARLPPGVYVVRATAGDAVATQRLTVVR